MYPTLNDIPDQSNRRVPTKFAIFEMDVSIFNQKRFFEKHDFSKMIEDIVNNDDFSVFHIDSMTPGVVYLTVT